MKLWLYHRKVIDRKVIIITVSPVPPGPMPLGEIVRIFSVANISVKLAYESRPYELIQATRSQIHVQGILHTHHDIPHVGDILQQV